MFRKLDDNLWIAVTLNTMAGVAIQEEDPARAEEYLADSRVVAQRVSDKEVTIGWTLNHLGLAAQLRGAYKRAIQFHEESLTVFGDEYHHGLLEAYQSLGESHLGMGRSNEATRWLVQGLEISRKGNSQAGIAWCLAGLGSAAALDEEPERAVALARAQLGEEALTAAWAEGRAMTLEQAIAYALED